MTSPGSRHPITAAQRAAAPLRALAVAAALALAGGAGSAAAQQLAQAGGSAGGAEAPRFFSELDDLPLMAGLQEMPEASVAFDKPGGRIGEVYAEGAVPAQEVRGFYAETLPEFGWKPAGDNLYRRDGERLELEVTESAGTTTLRISLSPTD